MKICTAFPGTRTYREVRRLYLSAFPPEQRHPFVRLWLLSVLKPTVRLQAYRDGDRFCGFTLTVNGEKYLYICFIAVNPDLRSRGCGSQILALLRQQSSKPLLVEAEAPEVGTANYTQRVQRIDFYRKNGFYDLDRTITGRGTTFALLSTDAAFDREGYWELFGHLSFGLRAWLKRLKGKR